MEQATVNPKMLKYLKVSPNSQGIETISLLLEELLSLMNIKKWQSCVTIDDFYKLFHPYAQQSKSIFKLLTRAERVWLIAVSLGEDIDFRIRQYFKINEFFRAYILDRLGSFFVEEEIKKMDSQISKECQENGYIATHRFSSGYGDFSIEAQKIFFNLIKDSIPELKLSSGYLLFPEKTITALKGIVIP